MLSADHRHRTLILGLVLLSLAARLAMLRGNQWQLSEDVDDYLRLAQNVADWKTFGSYDIPEAYRPPLYPLVLAPLYGLQSYLGLAWGWRVTAISLLHLGFGAGTTVLTFQLARRWGLGRWSLLAAALVALDPILLHHVRKPMTETLAALLVAAALYGLSVSQRRAESWISYTVGLILGLGMLCRTTIWAFALLSVVVAIGNGRR
jgi:4-amino-4-deoxy-L-arabinose transferase-like glycosyltransferase